MDNFLSKFSKPTLIAVSLIGGILFIVISDPPHTLCTTQQEIFKEEVGNYLFIDGAKQQKAKGTLKSGFQKDIEYCRSSNRAGGCYEFFFNLRDMLRSFHTVSNECKKSVGGSSEVRVALWEIVELMVRIAWGGTPPRGIYDKYSWMDTSDMNLFCNIKQLIKDLYVDKNWVEFRERMIKELPGADQLSRQRTWELMILSDDCAQF